MIINADILEWAASYDGPLLLAFVALKFSISYTVTGIAERYKVAQFVCFFVALYTKQPKRHDMVNILTSSTAALTCVVITLQSFASLCLPIGTAILRATVDILWMIQSMAVCITAWARAVFTAALALFQPASADLECFTAVKAIKRSHFGGGWACLDSSVLASWRAVFAPTVFQSAGLALKRFSAMSTYKLYLFHRWGILCWLSFVSLAHACNRTESRICDAVRLNTKRFAASLAN